MLGGVPAHYTILLVGAAALLGFGLMSVDKVLGLSVVVAVLVTWGLLAVVFGKDRVQVPLFFLRLFHRFPRKITSYSRSYQRVVIEE